MCGNFLPVVGHYIFVFVIVPSIDDGVDAAIEDSSEQHAVGHPGRDASCNTFVKYSTEI